MLETRLQELVHTLREGAEHAAEEAAILLQREFDEHADPVFGALRRFDPVVANRLFAVVTRHADVTEVLSDHQTFSVRENGLRMRRLAGPFILGEDDTELYRRHDAALRRVVRPEDLPRLRDHVFERAGRILDERAREGAVDIVAQYADPVLADVSGFYLGAPGPDEASQARWAKAIFHELFINVTNVTSVRERGEEASEQMREHLERVIAARKRAVGGGKDDVLRRLLALSEPPRLDDREIRDNLLGLITGWIPTASKALAMAMMELLERPDALEQARAAATEGDESRVRDHVWEALRFRPQNSGLLRYCEQDRTIARGTHRETTIRKGSTVFVATQSAMMDPEVVQDPRTYRPGRPPECYMHFGQGLHRCWGEFINEVQLPAMAAQLLKRPGLRHARGERGRLRWDGPYPGRLVLEFNA